MIDTEEGHQTYRLFVTRSSTLYLRNQEISNSSFPRRSLEWEVNHLSRLNRNLLYSNATLHHPHRVTNYHLLQLSLLLLLGRSVSLVHDIGMTHSSKHFLLHLERWNGNIQLQYLSFVVNLQVFSECICLYRRFFPTGNFYLAHNTKQHHHNQEKGCVLSKMQKLNE